MKRFMIILLFVTSYMYAADETRNYEEQIAFIFQLTNKFTITEIGSLQYPEHTYTMYKITYGSIEEKGGIHSGKKSICFYPVFMGTNLLRFMR